jgi:hypothetical protein
MSCTVCRHPERQAIDLALLDRTATLAQLSGRHHLSQSALHRHKQHLLKKMALAQNHFQDLLREGYLFILNKFLAKVQRVADLAGAEGNTRLLLQAVRQGTDIMKFMAKLDSSLTPDTVHRLLAAPQCAEPGSLLPTDPQFVAACHQALADRLFSPCPEPAAQEDAPFNSQLSAAASPDLADLPLDQLQDLLSGLSPSQDSSQRAPHPARREKSGKFPGKTSHVKKNNQENQEAELYEKIAGMLDLPLFGPNLPLGTGNSKLETVLQQCHPNGNTPADKPLSETIYEQSLRANQRGKAPGTTSCCP